ncbi:MAG: tetratricopeptide repeat protein [Rhodoglobus sp.]
MSRDVITLQPEVEEILRELAKRPGSALLRVPRKDVVRTVLERDTMVHARSAGLSAAERHLVQVHREEVAFALRQAAYYRLAADSERSKLIADQSFASIRSRIPSLGAVRAEASEVVAELRRGRGDGETLEILESCIAPDPTVWPTAGQLAATAHRLIPSNTSRVYMSLDLRSGGQDLAALAPLRCVIQVGGSSAETAVAWSNLADALVSLGQYEKAYVAAEEACRTDPDLLIAQLNRTLCSILVGDVNRLARGLESLDRFLREHTGAVGEAVTCCRRTVHGSTRRILKSKIAQCRGLPLSLAKEVLDAAAN